jgi:hypothetical protein
LAQVGKHGVIGAVIVPVLSALRNPYKSAAYNFSGFSFSCNLHEGLSCILHFALSNWLLFTRNAFSLPIMTLGFPDKFHPGRRPYSGYKTFQILRVQAEKG